MTQPPDFTRKPLLCPKCGGKRMIIQEIREMYHAHHPPAMPLFDANIATRIVCAEIGCGVEVWPKGWVEVKAEKGKKG